MPQSDSEASEFAVCRIIHRPTERSMPEVDSYFAMSLGGDVIKSLLGSMAVGSNDMALALPAHLEHRRRTAWPAPKVVSLVVDYPAGVPKFETVYRLFEVARLEGARWNEWWNVAAASLDAIIKRLALDRPDTLRDDGDKLEIVGRKGGRTSLASLMTLVQRYMTQNHSQPRTVYDIAVDVSALGNALLRPVTDRTRTPVRVEVMQGSLVFGEVVVADRQPTGDNKPHADTGD